MIKFKEFKKATEKWKILKKDYNEVKKVFLNPSIFHFTQEDRNWINQNNATSSFRIYIGILNAQLHLIVVPLDAEKKVKKLKKYIAKPIEILNEELVLEEISIVTRTKKTILSPNLRVLNRRVEEDLPFTNEPSLDEDLTISEIQTWSYECYNWFYRECNEFSGERIFNYFSVPFSDLGETPEKSEKILCTFGMKDTKTFNFPIPVLIFISYKDMKGRLFSDESNDNRNYVGNAADWTSPCPPFCHD